MTMPEKLLALRTARGLSQGDLAEQLEVSRQSVSKWETGQSVPDLDRIIKLADLYGVTVDELVREGAGPEPPQPGIQTVYMEKKAALTPIQIAGIICEAVGAGLAILGLMGAPLLVFGGAALVCLGLPLLLANRLALLIDGWLLVAGSWLVFNPWTSVTPFGLWGGVRLLVCYFTVLDAGNPALLLGACIALGRGMLTLALLVLTWRVWRRQKTDRRR